MQGFLVEVQSDKCLDVSAPTKWFGLYHGIQQSAERCHDSRGKEQFLVAPARYLQEANNFLLVSTVGSSVLVFYGLLLVFLPRML
ncbi:MAG: hypothetical protein HWQ38_16685 [Nostoc sp. NMS7]|uniref:hypothetical protein n=1 Tax=Nostoc sp. NMS7 TaxID=2815391 RepID=UPI00345955BD|nr:hypothetical protein [Nostoc sp. NMS7]